ncbi:Tagatose 1,6-diphosphate aldolase [Streptococcus mitis]|uniref:Tagatose 1,6-diphosphate aldolase n=1 Tax=Streptococcus mitis TaxID=28037 RepID=A0A150NFV4_STRMT|nr:Tagatose 1,6-diphosphate aldolase [Streptococcus mitis]
MALTEQKRARLEKLSDENGIISALAFDQRGALKRLMAQHQTEEPTVAQMEELKVLVADELTKYASSMLLDPEYGLPATKALDEKAGLLLAYEKQVMTQQAQNACQTAWMFGLQNVLKKKVQMQLNSCFTMM